MRLPFEIMWKCVHCLGTAFIYDYDSDQWRLASHMITTGGDLAIYILRFTLIIVVLLLMQFYLSGF